jgi:flagellar motor switch protein FliN/FliY
MSQPLEKQLISAFTTAWNDAAPKLFRRPSTLGLLAQREVAGEQMASTLAVANTWSAAFAAPCSGALPGVVIFLFKTEDGETFDRVIGSAGDGGLKPGGRTLVGATLHETEKQLIANNPDPVEFGTVHYVDLIGNESHLGKILGDKAWVGTFSLSVGDDVDTQALVLYGANSKWDGEEASASRAFQAATSTANATSSGNTTAQSSGSQHQASPSRRGSVRQEEAPRNIDRLLEVELDVVVRFGMTHIPLRDIVRMGVGTMIELNRAVDEPVELLVNGRLLARGEVVVVDGYYGVRITEISSPAERAALSFA